MAQDGTSKGDGDYFPSSADKIFLSRRLRFVTTLNRGQVLIIVPILAGVVTFGTIVGLGTFAVWAAASIVTFFGDR